MRERGMGGYWGKGMFTWDLLDGCDGNFFGCCDECVGGVGGGDGNYEVGCDYGAGDGTAECGADGDVFDLVEGRNVGNVEGYSRGESGGWDGGEDDVFSDGLMDVVNVGDG